MRLKIAITALWVIIGLNLFAGVKIIMTSESGDCGDSDSNGKSTLYMRSDIFRMDMSDGRANMTMIYKKSEQSMWVLDRDKKEYYTITKEDMDKIKQVRENAQKQMEEQLKNIPEAQREQMMKMMGGAGMAQVKEAPKLTYKNVGESKSFGEWSCDKYECYEGETMKEIHWVASEAELEISRSDFEILESFSEFMSSSFGNFDFGPSRSAVLPEKTYEGLPVVTEEYRNGSKCSTTTVQSIEKTDLADELFKIPKDFRKNEPPMKRNR